MSNLKAIVNAPLNHSPKFAASIANISRVLSGNELDISVDTLAPAASSKNVEAVKAQKITFFFGDQVIGEVKFIKAGTKSEKVARCKKQLMKNELKKNPDSLVAQRLFSPFCHFKIN